ncbi:hypothetical protein TWF569_006763 [Orbilia oligospora]|uniref:Uncharacterized protein n=1 Tax=Orbilia oligospora TaxID=2813651 RepID=A0A7C8K7R1_ORBOL|nr:hypothetical protein TWF102_006422 [Orbilia oligospora]KAF3106650.1 hypothetical protein TWF706_003173 [Orbilia oligospora]KAF3109719.1 hypothetical protein TWF103_005080 [Orbilia oligospora]KAF3128936.1 hypothetical protein TWF703_009131 [Orbilia oligospora]KAF3151082.1 hypothetical protein TWF594_008290 [Orbilia oligospora]
MGLLSYLGLSSSTPPPPKTTAPDRSERAKCWESRDLFFTCLDKHDILDSIKDSELANKNCGSELKLFDRDCASSWVEYFKKRRVQEHKKAKLLEQMEAEGGQPLNAVAVAADQISKK